MANSMQHWNGHQLCAIDIETTGLDSAWHEMVQLAILPLDSNVRPRKDILPFYINLVPDHMERIDPAAMTVTKTKLADFKIRGVDREAAKDLLDDWVGRLDLPFTPSGFRKRITPLGHNYAFDKGFIEQWLGTQLYSEYFDSRYRDTLTVSLFLNDRAGMQAEPVPYPKNKLSYVAGKLGIDCTDAHDALVDCKITAEVYRKMCFDNGVMG